MVYVFCTDSMADCCTVHRLKGMSLFRTQVQLHAASVSVSLSPAQGELEATFSMTNKLEELRKEGGDRWLAILNAQRVKKEAVSWSMNT